MHYFGDKEFLLIDGNHKEIMRSQEKGECYRKAQGMIDKGAFMAPLRIVFVDAGKEFMPPKPLKLKTCDKDTKPNRSTRLKMYQKTNEKHSKLKKLRIQKGLSQNDLGKAVGTNQTNISFAELGKNINPSIRFKLAHYFGVPVQELFS